MLRGYTRPVKRVIAELQERGLVPLGDPTLLDPVYEAGARSSHFAVPPDVVLLLREDREP